MFSAPTSPNNTTEMTSVTETSAELETTLDTFNCGASSTPNSSIITTTPLKTAQFAPIVYIQTPAKIPFTSITKSNNIIMNNAQVSQLQFATLPNNIVSNKNQSRNQGVILTSMKKPQQLVIHKPSSMPGLPMVSVSSGNKITGAYLTMLKPVTKMAETKPEGLQVISTSTVIQSTNSGQKYVIAPMPKVIKNRLPVTVTTNTLQPKIAFMPISIPTSNDTHKTFNFKIADGQLHNSDNCNNINEEKGGNNNNLTNQDLVCDEVINLDSPVKTDKEYELSIMEDSNSKDDCNVGLIEEKRKEMPKFTKHGISILKKKYQGEKLRPLNIPTNNTNSVLDCDLEVNAVKLQKTERRRKSNFSYRKDYDDMENNATSNQEGDVTLTKLENCGGDMKLADDLMEIEKEKESDINMNKDCDVHKLLKWENGIGILPGSDLKFVMNEFDIIEYLTMDDYNKMTEKKAKAKLKNELQDELRCQECGCYGQPSEFVTAKYCSLDCQEVGANKSNNKEKELKVKKKKKKGFPTKKSEEFKTDKDQSGSDEGITSNENSQDKFSYPWTCSKKGFSWTKYLDHIKAKAAPVKLFKDAFPYNRNGFKAGMKLEGVDPHHPSYFCVLTVAETSGYRVRLHFDGYPDNYDFWLNADSMDIFPVGWCEKHGHVLQPPPGYTVENFNWVSYLKQTKTSPAPKHLFANRAGNAICPNGFRVGMKLEAVDRKNSALVCVATVKDMMDNRILVHFDSWDDIYDYWADPTSPYIHPVGWCDQNGHSLTPPNDYPNPETFSWAKYLKETKASAAPVRAFKQRQLCGFKRGMRLECVDRRVPQLIRAATVDDVRDHQIRIQFDGWPDRYSYWVDDDNENIHPVGWCQKTGHPIETPLTPDDVYDFLECPTVGCRGLGHIQGPKFSTHSEQKFCPYAEDNIDVERVLPDRLLTPDRLIEAVIPVSREPSKVKPRIGRPPKYPRLESSKEEREEAEVEDEPMKKPKRKYRKRVKPPPEEEEEPSKLINLASFLIEQAKIEPATKEVWTRHSRFLKKYTNVTNVRHWDDDEVADFVAMIPGCVDHAEQFKFFQIDGEAFLSLSQKDIIDILNMKVGPAIKLYNLIVLLRQKVS